MSGPPNARRDAPRRFTSATLTGGVAVAAAAFGLAMLLEILGLEPGDGEMTDLAAIARGLLGPTPWAWATLGAYAVVLTPVLGLLVSAAEYWSVDDRRTVLLVAAVLAVLAVSAVVAVLR